MEKYYRLEDIAKTVCEKMDLSTEEWDEVSEAIERVPAADVEPVRHGHWIKDGSNRHECSECHKAKWVWGNIKMEYCEHCGAKMDGWRRLYEAT